MSTRVQVLLRAATAAAVFLSLLFAFFAVDERVSENRYFVPAPGTDDIGYRTQQYRVAIGSTLDLHQPRGPWPLRAALATALVAGLVLLQRHRRATQPLSTAAKAFVGALAVPLVLALSLLLAAVT